ncbi:putative holin-like toxin [Jeotgalibacillus malaysiensis]|uniref:putative holin-like toxin n=1 Tax=Jeotgalibacillus malaysiensis TaxID=1508404 RepID=UPI00384C3FF5
MVTYEAMNMLFQFGMFIAAVTTAIVALVALYTNKKSNHPPLPTKKLSGYSL